MVKTWSSQSLLPLVLYRIPEDRHLAGMQNTNLVYQTSPFYCEIIEMLVILYTLGLLAEAVSDYMVAV